MEYFPYQLVHHQQYVWLLLVHIFDIMIHDGYYNASYIVEGWRDATCFQLISFKLNEQKWHIWYVYNYIYIFFFSVLYSLLIACLVRVWLQLLFADLVMVLSQNARIFLHQWQRWVDEGPCNLIDKTWQTCWHEAGPLLQQNTTQRDSFEELG